MNFWMITYVYDCFIFAYMITVPILIFIGIVFGLSKLCTFLGMKTNTNAESVEFYCESAECDWTCTNTMHHIILLILIFTCPIIPIIFFTIKYFKKRS